MADIYVQRRGGKTWLWGLLGLIVLGLVLWILAGNDENELSMEPVEEVLGVEPMIAPEPAPEAMGATEAIPVVDIVTSPTTWVGQTIDGNVRVLEPVNDRAFWVGEDGQRLFTLVIDESVRDATNIHTGATLRVQQAVVADPTYLAQVHGETVDAATRGIAAEQSVFLVVDAANVTLMNQQ